MVSVDVAAILSARLAEGHRVINVVGPLGVGKSRLLAVPRPPGVIVVDEVDSAAAVARLSATVRNAPPGSSVVAAGRRPLAAWPQWRPDEPPVTVQVAPWPPARIGSLTRSLGISHPVGVRLVTTLSGGIPLIAEQVGRAVLCGVPVDARAAIAAAAAREVLRRLAVEGADTVAAALTALAALGTADEEMLAGHLTPGGFEALSELSVVRWDGPGLVLVEPYRTLLDLGLRWRRPLTRQALLAGGIQHRLRQVSAQRDRRERAAVAGSTLALLDDPVFQESLFPAAEPTVRIRPAEPGDEEDTVRLVQLWARRSGLDTKSCGRMLQTWWAGRPSGFYLAVRPDGQAVGMSNILPLRETSAPAQGPLLQQHADALRADADELSSVLVGLAVSGDGDPSVEAAILRHALATGMRADRLLVSTPWTPYQSLCERLGLREIGETRHDVYRCGRPNRIYLQDFASEALPAWLRRVSSAGAGREEDWERHVRDALAHLGDPARLASNPLVALPAAGSAGALAAMLRTAIETLAISGAQPEAEAAQALAWRYLDPSGGAAARIGGSRATYFRRLRYGVRRVTQIVQGMSGDTTG